MRRTACMIALLLACAGGPTSAQPFVDVRVISISGRSIYINKGREAGISQGTTLVITLPDGRQAEAIVQEVSANNSRAELRPNDPVPGTDARVELRLAGRPAGPEPIPAPASKPVQEHPPWSRKPEQRDADAPLLSPAFGTAPEDRPMSIHGRVFNSLQFTHDNASDADYAYSRLGTWLEVDNPFHDAGRIIFAGDLDYRGADLWDGHDQEYQVNLDWFSYARGLEAYSPYRFEVGRFYPSSLPEIGVFDGAEGKLRFENGISVGAGVGFYPVPFPETPTWEDYGFHFFADYQTDNSGALSATVGYQQTWHEGEQDRNVLIARVNARPCEQLWLYGMAMVDLYGPEDDLKDTFDLTQALAQATYTPDRLTGISGTYVHTTWPELLRTDYRDIPDSLVRTGVVDRFSSNVWRRITEDIRLSLRGSYWVDQDADGFNGEFGTEWTDVLFARSYVYAGVFFDKSKYNDGYGGRLQVRQEVGEVMLGLGYEAFNYSIDRLSSGKEYYLRHTIRADVGWSSGDWYFNVDTSYNFGDNEDAISVGAFVEYRF